MTTSAPDAGAVPGATTSKSGNSRKYQRNGHSTRSSSAITRLRPPVVSRTEARFSVVSRERRLRRSTSGRTDPVAVCWAIGSVPSPAL